MEIKRKLATVRQVLKKEPIEGADRIELIHVDGWKVIAQKDLYKEGDKVVYFEVDSFLPVIPAFEWLRQSSFRSDPYMGEGFRVRTMKMRGVVSQGVLMPLEEILPDKYFTSEFYPCVEVGTDLTEDLGVKLWDPPVIAENAKGRFPGFIPKTDQERWQNITKELEAYQDTVFEVSEKLDGSSITVFYRDGVFGVCSRNLEVTAESKFFVTAKKLQLDELLPDNHAIQGELVGPGIQGNKYGLKTLDIYFFSAYNISESRYLNDLEKFMLFETMGVKAAPNIAIEKLRDIDYKTFNWKSKLNGETIPEGVVLKNFNNKFTFKSINPEFLLKE